MPLGKFVVIEVAPLGCLPDVLDKIKPSTTLCDEQINGLVSVFDTNLGVKLNQLKSVLNGSTFLTAKSYRLIHDIIHNPQDAATIFPCPGLFSQTEFSDGIKPTMQQSRTPW